MKQRFWNSSCFGDHDATKVWCYHFFHCETSALEFTEFFFKFCKYSTHCIHRAQRAFIEFYCKIS